MKIFNRPDAKPATPNGAEAAPAPAQPAAATPAPAAAEPAPAPAAPPAPDLSAILDANVKEMSERIARLASSLEGQQQEKAAFDAKIEQMEERMRKLSSLTEMISAQYNPFVGDAPRERESLPSPDVGLASPPVATSGPAAAFPPSGPSAAFPPMPAADFPSAAGADADAFPPASGAPGGLTAILEAPPVELAPPEAPAPPSPAAAVGHDITPPAASWDDAPHAQPPTAERASAPEAGVRLWAATPGFESSMLMLGWADMLLTSAGSRQNLLELVNYYHNLGWIGDPARDQLLGYSDGLTAPEDGAQRDWRVDLSVHERSLLYVEKLRACATRRS